jgi:ATP-dependent protease ClpP protease subunit
MAWNYEIKGEASGLMEVNICDAIGEAGKGATSADIRAALKTNKTAKEIVVNLHSAGGEVLDGLAIYNLLASHPAKVTVKIDTLAASIASVIAMAGDEIQVGKGAFLMVHNPYAQTKGGSEDLRKLADVLDKMRDSMVAIYAKRTGQSDEYVRGLMEAETWMTGAEAVEHGFADKVVDSKSRALALDDLKIYANVPSSILGEQSQMAPGLPKVQSRTEAGDEKMDEKTKEELGKLFDAFEKKMDAKFGKKAKAEEECDNDEDEELPEGKGKAELSAAAKADVMSALVEANKAIKAMSDKLAIAEKSKFEARVSGAITEGKLLPAQKAWALGLEESIFDKYLEAVGDNRFPVGKEHKEDGDKAKELVKASAETELTAEEKKLAKNMGISEAELIAYNKVHPKVK